MRQLEDLARLGLRHRLRARGIGRPTTRYFAPPRVSSGYARKTRFANGAASRFARPRCASASVSAAGMRIVAAASTIGPATKPPPPSTTSGRRCRRIARHARGADPASRSARASSTDGRRGSPVIAERVELVAGLRNEPRFDAIRRPGERHVYAAARQRVGDRERGQHVACRPPGCDQAPKLPLHCHAERC